MKAFIAYTNKNVATRMSTDSIEHLKGLLHREEKCKNKTYQLKEVELVGSNQYVLETTLIKEHGSYKV